MTLTGRVRLRSGALERTEWLYTRAEESVRIELAPEGAVLTLVIAGPGVERQIRAYPSQEALDVFLAEFEQDLTLRGFRLMAVAERRQEHQGTDTAHERRRNGS